jgi:predicted small lipoprotein YifL
MKRPAGILVLALSVVAAAPSCGRKGPLRPPVAREPQPVGHLGAVQRDTAIVIGWTNPTKYADGRSLPGLAAAELWGYEMSADEAGRALNARDFEARARLLRRVAPPEFKPPFRAAEENAPDGVVLYGFEGAKAGSLVLALSVRVLDAANRPSRFAVPLIVRTRACPVPPAMGEPRLFRDRIELDWTTPAANIDGSAPAALGGYTVYRSEDRGRFEKRASVPAGETTFADRDFEFGRTYSYFVRASTTESEPGLESGDSETRDITPRDVFPPGAPAGLVAVAGPGVISLSWEAGREANLAGYKIWRREEGGAAFRPLVSGLVTANAFTDASVEKGKTYIYAVSACDRDGNESPKTESGPVTLKGDAA